MFNHAFLGSPDFLERLQGTLCGFQEFRARRYAAQHAAYASPVATMHAAPGPRSAPMQSPPGGGGVLLCYQQVQGRLVPVYASPDDLPGATAHGGAPTPEAPPRPEPASHGVAAPASPPPAAPSGGPPERTPPVSAANSEARTPVVAPVEPPDFSAQAVQASVPPRTAPTRPASSERAPAALNLAPPTPPPIVRPTEEKTDTIERILAQHRTDMEAAEARHAAAVQELHAQHRAEMEAAEARHAAGLQGALADCRQMVSELLAQHREALGQQQRPGADDAQAFAELRELLAEQARVMRGEHDNNARLTSDLLEMINNLGETVNHLAVAVAERKAPPFAPPPSRSPVPNHDALRKPGPAMTIPMPSTVAPPAPAAHVHEPTTAPRAATTTATVQDPGPAPAAAQAGAEAPPPASAKPVPPNAESPATSPVPSPAAHDAAPTRSLTVVRDSEPIRRTATPAVRHPAPSAVLSSAPARACATSLSASLMSIFASSPPATASASMTARQQKAAEEAREREHIYDVVDDVTDEELEDMQTESGAPRG